MRPIALMVALLAAPPALADVTASSPGHFVIDQSVTIDAPIAVAWETLRNPAKWWNPDHTYAGNAANLYMDAQATGCFCERLPDKGSVEHMHIVYVAPGRMIRMTGGLGPLQAEAVAGTMVWKLDVAGTATKLTLGYMVSGHMRQGGEAMAPLVDKVLAEQVSRLKAAAEAAAEGPPPAEAK